MFQKLRKKYQKLSLLSKVRLVVFSSACAIFIVLILLSLSFYYTVSSNQLYTNSQAATANAAQNMNVNDTDIVNRFASICSSSDFVSDVQQIIKNPAAETLIENNVQTELNDLGHCNYLVSTPLILSGDCQHAYSLYDALLRKSPDEIFPENTLQQIHGITYLPQMTSPFRGGVSVIPMAIPVKLMGNLLTIPSDGSTPDIYVIIFLNASKLNEGLNAISVGQTTSNYYLVSSAGSAISRNADGTTPSVLESDAFQTLFDQLNNSGSQDVSARENGYYISLHRIHRSGMVLVNYVQAESLIQIIGQNGYSLILIAIIILVVIMTVSFFTTNQVVNPVKKLVSVVHRIEKNEYREKITFASEDEVGQLLTAINGMYDTIQLQIEQIKSEEAEKYKTELKLMTEQINPHFLYNTLEEIQSEVLQQDAEAASNMIQYLASYLRISLSGGADAIPVSKEIQHANAYIRIMNQRFRQSILFLYRVAPSLSEALVLKTILQPLIENSIRHGFGIDSPGLPASVPSIEVIFSAPSPSCMQIEVSDNGSGFDEKKVTEILYHGSEADGKQHVGIHNVYRRLCTYYGENNIRIQARSIPYYRNTITILITQTPLLQATTVQAPAPCSSIPDPHRNL